MGGEGLVFGEGGWGEGEDLGVVSLLGYLYGAIAG